MYTLRYTITWMLVFFVSFLTLNCTIPLQRHTYYNYKNGSDSNIRPLKEMIIERNKKMATNIENAFRKIKDTTQNWGKNIYDHVNISAKCFLNKNDLKQYEQLVIRKKYPYLDLNDVDMKLNPTNKNARQNVDLQEISNFNEPSVFEESINVEIFNRGLSGVAIPNKKTGLFESTVKNLKEIDNVIRKTSMSVLDSLKTDVDEYLKIKCIGRT